MTSKTAANQAQITNDLRQMVRVLEQYPALARAITDPAATAQNKASLIDRVFTAMSGESRTLLKQCVDRSWESTTQLVAWAEELVIDQAWQWAAELKGLDRAIDEVFAFGQLVYRDHQVRAAVTDRRASIEQRQQLVQTMLAATVSAPAVEIAMAAVVCRRGTIDDSISAFLQAGVTRAGAKLAVATVAKPLPDEQKRRLGVALAARVGAPVIVEEIVDPAVLGGVRVECGSEVIDSTMASRLETVRRDFT